MNPQISKRGRFVHCTALVTGAAKGIGEAIATALAREGARVWLADVDDAGVKTLAAKLQAEGACVHGVHLDVTSDHDWQQVAAHLLQEAEGLDILVNNAGIAPVAAIEDTHPDLFRQVMQVNAESVFLGIRNCLQVLRQRSHRRVGGSSVINIASLLAVRALPHNLAYGASKAAVLQIGKCAAIELARQGDAIRVNNVLPAVTDTPMVTQEVEEWARQGTMGTHDVAQTRKALDQRIPIGRIGQPMDIAQAVLFLASEESAFMTGVDLPVDGGRSAV